MLLTWQAHRVRSAGEDHVAAEAAEDPGVEEEVAAELGEHLAEGPEAVDRVKRGTVIDLGGTRTKYSVVIT